MNRGAPRSEICRFILCIYVVIAVVIKSEPLEDHDGWRLPRNVVPKKYDLYLYPNLQTGLFKGKVVTTVDVKTDSKEITMHSHGLNIKKVDIDGKKAKAETNEKFQLLIVSFEDGSEIQKGERVITISYNGDMKNRIVGLYKSSYVAENGERRVIATTQFEPTNARKAFPCFDEPNMKAKYQVHILKPKNDSSYIALSNMPQEEKEDEEENGIMVHFKESVQMSTYLACFIVCDFKYTETFINSETDKIPLRVYATPAQVNKTHYALEFTKGAAEYFLNYFNIKYPLPKLDLIAIPDFSAGAMEHWGLITYREVALLYDDEISSTITKLRVAVVISHELAHSWFGNLVTMNWWNDLWLNEGFASYIEYKGVDAVHKDWQMLDQFLIEDLHSALSVDATPASHPIVKTIVTPDQITEAFDTITYRKGAGLVRMLEGAVGEKAFQEGVTAYLNANAWGNAETTDLWKELQTIVGPSINITDFMDTWTRQMGYPVLTIKEEGDDYVITQKRFLKNSDNAEDTESPYRYKWTIPVTYITDKDQENPTLVWFDHTKDSLRIKKPKDVKWIKFNHKQIGFYRVNYPKTMWKLLADNINNLLSVSDKTHLIEEAFSIAESGDDLLDYNVPLDLTKYLKHETNYIPWRVAANKLEGMRKYLFNTLEYGDYLNYVESIVKPAYEAMTWIEKPEDGHLTRRARVTILGLACSFRLPECLREVSDRFEKWLENPKENPLPRELRSIIYTYGMQNAGKEQWEKLLQILKTEIDASEKLNLMKGLAAAKDPWLLRRLIEVGKDEQVIRGQDYFTMLQFVSENSAGTLMVWDYVRENWDDLVERFSLNDRYLGRLIPTITKNFVRKTKLKEMKAFFEEYPNAGAGAAARAEALANVNNNIKWMQRNKDQVEHWLKENTQTGSPSK